MLVLAGLVSWALYINTSGDEPHAYSRGGRPPAYVRVVPAASYRLAIRGGVRKEIELGFDPASLSCTANRPGEVPGALKVSPETKGGNDNGGPINDIGSFVSTIRGMVHVACAGLGPVFVDNAAGAAYDWSGLWLVLASLALIIGGPLVLSVLRAPATRTTDSQDQGVDSGTSDVDRVDPAAEELL